MQVTIKTVAFNGDAYDIRQIVTINGKEIVCPNSKSLEMLIRKYEITHVTYSGERDNAITALLNRYGITY